MWSFSAVREGRRWRYPRVNEGGSVGRGILVTTRACGRKTFWSAQIKEAFHLSVLIGPLRALRFSLSEWEFDRGKLIKVTVIA